MADFLFLLARLNIATGAAVLVVFLLRRPVRAIFHANIAYGLWLLVAVVMLAVLLPERFIWFGQALVPTKIHSLIPFGQLLKDSTLPQARYDWSGLVALVWVAGMVPMALYMRELQRLFKRDEEAGVAGPAVVGFIRQRIVLPADFNARFNVREQIAILAHEQAHVMRQDARINAVAALLRCACWFNPLVHLGTIWMRWDQELACDSSAIRSVSRRDYANALLKAHMPTPPPLGCSWLGSEHPLTERVALLGRPAPRGVRRWGGLFTILLLTMAAGVTASAQQQPQNVFQSARPATSRVASTQAVSSARPIISVARLLLPLPRTNPEEVVPSMLRTAAQIRQKFRTCEQLEAASRSSQLKDSVFTRQEDLKRSAVSEDLWSKLTDFKSDGGGAVVLSDASIEIIVRCDGAAAR